MFPVGVVYARARTDESEDVGLLCEECVGLLGNRYPHLFPTREDFEDALRRYPQPVLTQEEYKYLGGAEEQDEVYLRTFVAD